MSRPNIILTGFMGSGKTTVGKLLARKLSYSFVDTDHLIEQRCGMSVQEIFKTKGEKVFLQMETAVARDLSAKKGLVIATGGRLMLAPDNAQALGRYGSVFCLAATPDEILARVSKGTQGIRPLLDTPDPLGRIIELIKEREQRYAGFTQVSTSGQSPQEVTREILPLFQAQSN